MFDKSEQLLYLKGLVTQVRGQDTTHLECPVAPGTTPLKQTHISKPRPDGWLEWLKTVWADRTEDLMASSCFTCWLGTVRVPWGCYLCWYRSINLSVTWMMRQKVSPFMVWWLELDDL